jgi:hypothetical protein
MGLAAALAASCVPVASAPPTRTVLHLTGSPYQRGLQHGTQLRDQIREFYTTLLTASLLPYLNREQPDIDSVLTNYAGGEYGDGQFSTQLLLDSAVVMQRDLPAEYVQEMQGIADGSGLTYDQVLTLNTFVDTTLSVRAVAAALDLSGAPQLRSVQFLGAATDGVDNDGDGASDQPGEGLLSPYAASPIAAEVELPPTVAFQFMLTSPHGVDPSSVQLTLDTATFTTASPEVSYATTDGGLTVTLTPAQPLPIATVHSVSIVAGDTQVTDVPPPAHEQFMRQEQMAFTIRGFGEGRSGVPNRSQGLPTGPPTSLAFAVTGADTPDGQTRLAQHFALLDDGTSHNNTAVFIHHPDDGTPPFAVVGWAGIVWGFSGLSTSGLGVVCQPSDTLDNAVVDGLIQNAADLSQAKILDNGMPMGFAVRQLLEQSTSVGAAVTQLEGMHFAYGWGCLLADSTGAIHATEMTSGLAGAGLTDYGPDPTVAADVDANGDPWSSIGPNDLRFTAHYLKDTADMYTVVVDGKRILPQSQWANSYFRSLDTDAALHDALTPVLGQVDRAQAESILSLPAVVNITDSMNAVVIEPGLLTLTTAMGTEPATDSPFQTIDLHAELP